MQIIKTAKELSETCRQWHREGKSVVLVPTMGYYHEGHASLMDKARTLGDKVVVSLFVNPTQFGPNEDYASYPRDLERDAAIAGEHGADLLFTPEPSELYAPDAATWVEVPEMSNLLCGITRPIHFRGVCTVCTKLFMLTQADYAVFGDKDWQQQAILRRMVRDLFYPVQIVGVPIVRAEDGLALSSRNVYLTEEERAQAPEIHRALDYARTMVAHGETKASALKDAVLRRWASKLPLGRLDYLQVIDSNSLAQVDEITGPATMACAVKMGKARLIDNIRLN
ncbi:MAG: pantoate--beta-alanine ligase [Desulfovibrionaceae bacterium]|nr:pantoate--beta-alanine ligase [Desulfovibrionaceae bacterium]